MLPTIVLANLCPTGPASRCGHLNIGDQVISAVVTILMFLICNTVFNLLDHCHQWSVPGWIAAFKVSRIYQGKKIKIAL